MYEIPSVYSYVGEDLTNCFSGYVSSLIPNSSALQSPGMYALRVPYVMLVIYGMIPRGLLAAGICFSTSCMTIS